jgi:cell division protein FtsB
MSKSLLIKNCQTFNSVKKENKSNKNSGFCQILTLISIFKVLLVMVGISCLSYLFQVNQLATMGKEINEREVRLEELKEENKKLSIKVAQLKSNYYIEDERERLKLVSPDQVSFVEIEEENSVAMMELK